MCARKIQMPREVYIGPGVVHETGEICSSLKLFKDIVLVTGNNTYDIAAKLLKFMKLLLIQ